MTLLKKTYLLLTACAALLALPAGAQTAADSASLPKIEYGLNNARTYEIADIQVTGAETYEDFVLIGFSGLEVGQKIEVPGDKITSAVKKFWRQGLFSDVKIAATKIEGNKIWLEIRLKQRPRASEVNFHGVKKSELEDLQTASGLSKDNQVTPDMIDRAKIQIKKILADKGFHNATIDIRQTNDPGRTGYVLLDVDIEKHQKTRIENVFFTGNNSLSDRKLNRAMKKTNDPHLYNFFRTKKFVENEYKNDKKLLIDKYNEYGYRDAYIVADSVVPSHEVPGKVDVYITVDEGQQYRMRNITWAGNTIYPREYLDAVLNIKRGDVYNTKKLNDRLVTDDDAVAKLYTDQGYLFFNADPVEVQIDNDSIDLEIRLYEGQPATINEVNISGNERVYEHVVRRELDTKPGQLYSQSDIMRSMRELAQMGQFKEEHLVPDIQPNPEDGTVDITYALETKGNDQLEFQFGWGQQGITLQAGVKFTNFAIQNLFRPSMYKIVPQGEGQTFSVSARTNGRYYSSYSISFLEPWLGGKRPNSLSVSAFFATQNNVSDRFYTSRQNLVNSYYNYYSSYYSDYYQQQIQSEIDPNKHFRTFGVSAGYGKRLTWPDDYFTIYAELSYQLYSMKNWDYSYYFSLMQNGRANNLAINLNLSRNSIDNPIYTRSGSTFSLGLKITPPYSLFNGKDYASLSTEERYKMIEYHKWKFSAKTFTPLSRDRKLVLMCRAELGYVGYFTKAARSPFETFNMGGDGLNNYNSYETEYVALRGYESGSLTPFDYELGSTRGSLYNKYTMELRFPVSLEQNATIWLHTFLEAGNCFTDFKSYNPFNLKRSAGVGVRIFLPMFGLMGLDWGYGFDDVPAYNRTAGGSHFHFVLGQEL